MSAGLEDLYQHVILDHSRSPRNFRVLDAGRRAEGANPLCGDDLTVHLRVDEGVIADVSFQGVGCAISKASASLMTERVKGKSIAAAAVLFAQFQDMLAAPPDSMPDPDQLGALVALAGVRQFPSRVRCASLPWLTLGALLESRDEVSSE